MLPWNVATPAIAAAFAASLVEAVEAFTVVLAVATLRGWRPAITGTLAALGALTAIVLLLGPLLGHVPLHALQFGIGVLLLLFGLGWLRKAVLRAAGVIALNDEEKRFTKNRALVSSEAARVPKSADYLAGILAFKAVLLEGMEVVFIVIAVGAGGPGFMAWAAVGAAAACFAVLAVGVAVRQPLSRVPENALKFGVGVMLCSFGVFWIGEGLGIPWPGEDLALLGLVMLFLLYPLGLAWVLKPEGVAR